MKCRHCAEELSSTFIDLGSAPPSNAYLTKEMLKGPEKWYPLKVMVCEHCWLVQTEDFVDPGEIFSDDYAYFSSYSTSWLKHAKDYVQNVTDRFKLNEKSTLVEIAANDGYLLQYVKARGIPCYGIEPTHCTAEAARTKGVEIVEAFFGFELAEKLVKERGQMDFLIANNVLAHVPDINDFVRGCSKLLKPDGIAAFEFPHLMNLVNFNQFDTIYHEHFSYLSLTAVDSIFDASGLFIFDIEKYSTHGGSLRIFAQKNRGSMRERSAAVNELIEEEKRSGIKTISYYKGFQEIAERRKYEFVKFLVDAKDKGKTVAAYGAAAKGNTLLNFCKVTTDLIKYVVDRNPTKQGHFLPGSHIPVVSEDYLKSSKPDFIVILPWNLKSEIKSQLNYVGEWGGQFVTVIPKLAVS